MPQMPDTAHTVPVTDAHTNAARQADPPGKGAAGVASVPAQAAHPVRKSGRRKWLLLALVFLCFTTILIVPAGRLPGMHSLVNRWGGSVAEANSASVGRVLWNWATGGEFGFSSMRADGSTDVASAVRSVFDNYPAPGFQPRGPQSGLFDLAAINSARRARGQRGESVGGLVGTVSVEEQQRAALNRVPQAFSAEFAENLARQNMEEVYFGADENVQTRAAFERAMGYGSAVDSSKMLANSLIIGSTPVDWLKVSIAKAAGQKEVDLQRGLEKVKQVNIGMQKFSGEFDESISPSSRDLAHVWLLSSVAETAQQFMLKKQLSQAGYMAMSVPQSVYDTVGEGQSTLLNIQEMNTRFELTNKQLLSNEQCSNMAVGYNEQIQDMLERANQEIRQLRNKVPRECNIVNGAQDDSEIDAWIAHLTGGKETKGLQQDICVPGGEHNGGMNAIFAAMEQLCGMPSPNYGSCEAVALNTYAKELSKQCQAYAIREHEYVQARQDLEGIYDETKTPPKLLEEGATQRKEKADAYEKETYRYMEDAYKQMTLAEKELAAERAKPSQEQDPQRIAALQAEVKKWTAEFNNWKKEHDEVAVPAQKIADEQFKQALDSFKKARWEFDEQTIIVYGKEHDKYKLKGSAADSWEGKKHTGALGLVNEMTEARIIKTFNLPVDKETAKIAEQSSEQWNAFFPTLRDKTGKQAIRVMFEAQRE